MSTRLRVAWWNLENLFDHENAVRDPQLKSSLRGELRGWSAAVRDRKIDQLARIVAQLFEGQGPDLLGVCEVENEEVMVRLAQAIDLPGRQYAVVAHESPDARGIDVSFLVDSAVLEASDPQHQVVIKRSATRDLFWMRVRRRGSPHSFVPIANHWPSRSAGQYSSEPFRMLTGETLAYVVDRLLDEAPDTPILVMGDFNDEPFNRSMQEYLLGTRDPGRVSRSRSGHLLNLMWPLMHGDDPGTYLHGSDWNMLDQFLAAKALLRRTGPVRVDRATVAIYRPEEIQGRSGRPRRFGRPARGLDEDGYSDHFPITVELLVAD